MNYEMVDICLFRSFMFQEKNYLEIADVMMLNDVQAYLVACFHWPIHCCKQHTLVFLSILQDKCGPKI